jgi:signal transduction histidine kinase
VLQQRVAHCIDVFKGFDALESQAIPYISAWHDDEMKIWYEFVSKRFVDLLGCSRENVADVLLARILDQRIYKYMDVDIDIQKEILTRKQLQNARKKLREDGKQKGMVDAVYKIAGNGADTIWLKDLATVETFEEDQICLSLGSLTVVTKEMKAEEERIKKEKLQVSLEMAGAVCHELNQPLQGILGYTENLLYYIEDNESATDKIKQISKMAYKMGMITKKLMQITRYETKDYVRGVKIVDINQSSKE